MSDIRSKTADFLKKLTKGHAKLIFFGALAACIVIAAFCVLFFRPRLKLTAEAVTVEAGADFDPLSCLQSVPEGLTVSGEADTSVPGIYPFTFVLGRESRTVTLTVVDTVPPAVTANAGIVFRLGEEILPENMVTAEDETALSFALVEDGQALTAPGTYSVTVRVTDAGGNSTDCAVEITVLPDDREAPSVGGIEAVTLYVGEEIDLAEGVTVTDEWDEAPVLKIDENGLDLGAAGTYTVLYAATDASGNNAVYERKITVKEKPAPKPNPAPTPAPQPKTDVHYTPEGGTYGWDAAGIEGQPYLVAVNRAMCTVTVYGKDAAGNYTVPVKAIVCSVGREGHETPTGRYTTTNRYEWRLMVDASYGRYAIRIHGGILFQSVCYYSPDRSDLEYDEYNKLGSPASLGCVRMSVRDARWLYDNCPTGFPTVIYDDAALSGPLGKPDPIRIDPADEVRRGWDPTDPSEYSPWNH